MAPKSKMQLKNQHSSNTRWKKSEEIQDDEANHVQAKHVNPDIAVLSTFIQGSNYRRARLGAAVQGNIFPPRSTFYKHQKKIIPQIENQISSMLAKTSDEAFDNGCVSLSVDGRYDSCRNAQYCSTSFMDCANNKVLSIKSVKKSDTNLSSNMLESTAARKGFDDMVSKYGKKCCSSITTDNDCKTYNQAKESGLTASRMYDPRHGIKSLSKSFERISNKMEFDNEFTDALEGKRLKIVSWGVYLINNIEDIELRGLMWLNSPEHMIGNHQNCMHGQLPPTHEDWELGIQNPELLEKMRNFFKRTVSFIKNCEFKNATQCNESLNNLIAMIAPKRLYFSSSYNVRALIAAGLYNEPHFFSNLLTDLNLDNYVPQEAMEEIKKYESERNEEIEKKRTPQYRKSKNDYRKKYYSKNKPSKGDYNDDKNDPTFE